MKTLKWLVPAVFVVSFLFLVLNLMYFQPRALSLEDVLAHRSAPVSPVPDPLTKMVVVVFGLSFFALSYEGFKWLKSGSKVGGGNKVLTQVIGLNADRRGTSVMQNENKDLLYLNEELDRENSRLLTEKQVLELEIKKYEDAVKKIGQSEELMRRSNEALRKGYEKQAQEKEAMILELNKKEWELRELSNAGPERKGKNSAPAPLLAAK
ncbi:MAG: hypothetical protein WC636_02850, partial [Candidatus Margulisiibacteriota bacterium]